MAQDVLQSIISQLSEDNLNRIVQHAAVDSQDQIRQYVYDKIRQRAYQDVYSYQAVPWAMMLRRHEAGGLIDTEQWYRMGVSVSSPFVTSFTFKGRPPKQHKWKHGGDLMTWVETGFAQGGAGARPFFTNTEREIELEESSGTGKIGSFVTEKVEAEIRATIGVK